MDKLAEARPDIDKALSEVPKDPLAWLLSATLARRMDNLPVAQEHIAQALALSPDDASVELEEGNIAVLSGMDDVSKLVWVRDVKVAPDSSAGKAANASMAQLAGETRTEETT